MPQIVVKIDVLNTPEIIRSRKGKTLYWLAHQIKGPEGLKRMVEEHILKEVVSSLKKNLDRRFKEEGILAKLKISVQT